MKVDFRRLTWENYPSTETPINADNLNRLEEGVAGLYSDMAEIEEELDGGVGEYVTDWLNEHVDPVGSAVVVDNTLSIEGAAADAKKTGDELTSLKEDFHEYHSELGAGYADQIVSSIENTDSVPYNFRKVPYDATLEKVEGIVGVDVVLNQLVEDGFSITGNASKALQNGVSVVSNHIYFYGLKRDVNTENVQSDLYTRVNGNPTPIFSIFMSTGGSLLASTIVKSNYSGVSDGTQGNGSLWFYVGSTATVTTTSEYMLFDLTAMFGTAIADYVYGLETATAGAGVAWLKEYFPKIFDAGYIAYNAGTMVHVSGLSAHKTVGFNLWDEEWEAGYYGANGLPVSNYTTIRSKNYIRVIPNTEYYYKAPNGTNYRICYFDANKNFIYRSDLLVTGTTFTTPSNCHFIMFHNDGATYNHDICINLSDPAKNGTYEPYEAHEYPLDSTIDLHGILKLDANNQLYTDGDVYKADGSVSRRYGMVDLGTLTWYKSGNPQRFEGSAISNAKAPTTTYTMPNIMTDIYMPTYSSDGASDHAITLNINGEPRIYDSAKYQSMSASEFKTAMNGVMCVYELATPTTETAEPYNPNQICDPNGTEEYISTTVAPVGHVTRYPENLRKKIEGLPWNFATLIAPTEATYVATRNYTTGSLFIVNNVLYKATGNIANGATITPNSNCSATTLAEIISALS